MTEALTATLRDAIALVSGHVGYADDPLLDRTLNAVIDDLQAADFDDVVVSFLGITLALVDQLADRSTDDTSDDCWSRQAALLSARITDKDTP
jgi:hypothetical protein